MSYIYLDESLTNDMFLKYLNMFKTIHSHNIPKDDQSLNSSLGNGGSGSSNTDLIERSVLEDIYSNYSAKILERYNKPRQNYQLSPDCPNPLLQSQQ